MGNKYIYGYEGSRALLARPTEKGKLKRSEVEKVER
jgi:hypothetical protein